MSEFFGGEEPVGAFVLDYEATLEALLSLIGRQVLVLLAGAAGDPFLIGVLSGRLDRGELDERLQAVVLRSDEALVETLFFHVGSRLNGFVLRPDEFERAFWRTPEQLVIEFGACNVAVLTQGELGEALRREP